MNIYFSGIGGIGISALAQLCLHKGHIINGSDRNTSNITTMLTKKGISIYLEQRKENVSKDIDIFVYSEAVPQNNPERIRAKELKIPCYSYFEYLGKISRDFRTIAVAGTHGKTTTTALAASGFLSTKIDPTVIVGTLLDIFDGTNFHAGTSEFLLVEACEYRENFRFLSPEIVIITGIDHDHIDAFPTEASYFAAFKKFITTANVVIYNKGDKAVETLLADFDGKTIAVTNKTLDLRLIGDFNQTNANLALGLTDIINIDRNSFTNGLQNFAGISRRQEYIGKKNGIKFYDDYAHHPVEIDALYQGFKQEFPDKKIGIVFEPHQHSRTKELFDGFCKSFAKIDFLGIMPIYAARDSDEDKEFTINNFLKKNSHWKKVSNTDEMDIFIQDFKPDDIIIFCGAGDISVFGRNFLAK